MKPTYYYPTKLSLRENMTAPEIDEWYDSSWKAKARALQARRWKKINEIEHAKKEARQERQRVNRQKRWLQRHGYPLIAQPVT